MATKTHKQKLFSLIIVIAGLLYFYFAYNLLRTEYLRLIGLYTSLFAVYYTMVRNKDMSTKALIVVSLLFRLIFLFSIPNLSQDFYRFIWDGRMILQGFNPYLHIPDSFISQGIIPIFQAQELFDGMGSLSATNYSNYPPISQICFILAGIFAPNSILGSALILRLIIIAADFGTFYFGKKLLVKLGLPGKRIFWYLLNPLIIIELTGNLHFEAVMIFFIVWSLYLLHSGKWKISAIIFAFSISVKLIPLLFLPLVFQYFTKENILLSNRKQRFSKFSGIKKLFTFYTIVLFVILLLFAPFLSSQFIQNYSQTIGLWFHNFEFNASIFNLTRAMAYLVNFNMDYFSIILPSIVLLFILIISIFRKNNLTIELITTLLLCLSFYYFTATTVHPWYISTIIFLSIFTRYRFPLVWSFMIVLSYGAYSNVNFNENLWVLGLEYLVVYAVIGWEVMSIRRGKVVHLVLDNDISYK